MLGSEMVVPILKVTGFVLWVNLLPPVASIIFGEQLNRPLDGGKTWIDGKPIFGPHKTMRGILISLTGGIIAAPILKISWWMGGSAAFLAMAGDLLSSFIKRRPGFPSGKDIFVLDQFFESLFPILLLRYALALSWQQSAWALCLFMPMAYAGTRLWSFFLYRPPVENFSRIVRSTVRFKEWRACHSPLARWQVLLNINSFIANRILLTILFKLLGLYEIGRQNALDVKVKERTFSFPELPDEFDGFRILLLTDLHLDGLKNLTDRVIEQVKNIEADLCLIGGDVRMLTYGPTASSLRKLRRLIKHIKTKNGILGVLGNHDCIEMAPDLEEAGILMLINDSWKIEGKNDTLWVVGIDDPHYYKVHDIERAFKDVPPDGFKIFLAHSPEAYHEASEHAPHLYLCGHTHGGQIRLPGSPPLYTNSTAPKYTAEGPWEYQGMKGYTSRGVGASGTPLRFNCPGEIVLLTLCKSVK